MIVWVIFRKSWQSTKLRSIVGLIKALQNFGSQFFFPAPTTFYGTVDYRFIFSWETERILIKFVSTRPYRLSVNYDVLERLKFLEFTECLVRLNIFHVRIYRIRRTLRDPHMWRWFPGTLAVSCVIMNMPFRSDGVDFYAEGGLGCFNQ